MPLLTLVGGPNIVDGGQSQEVILNLSSGQYVATCFIPSKDHHGSHVTQGMIKFFQVVDSANASQVSQPVADGQVTLKDFSFVLPKPFKAMEEKITFLD